MPLLGGVRPPIAVLLTLLVVVSGLALFTVGNSHDRAVSRAIIDSQGDIAADSARSLGASLEQNSADLSDAVSLLGQGGQKSPKAVLDSLAGAYDKWRGLAVVDAGSGKLLAARGEKVPLDDTEGLKPRLVVGAAGAPRLVSYARLEGGDGTEWLVVSSGALRLPAQQGGRTTYVTDANGRTVAASGPQAGDTGLRAAVQDWNLDVRREGGRYFAVGRAEVPGGEHVRDLGLTVATVVPVPAGTAVADDRRTGLAAAGALLAVGLLVTWLLVRYVQRPLLGLHQEARRIARGDLGRPVAVRAARGEARRIARVLESLRLQLLNGSGELRPRKRRGGLRAVVVCCAALVAAWAVALPLVTYARSGDHVPDQAARDQQYRTQAAADRVRRTLGETVADLSSIARLADGTRGGVGEVLDDELPGHDTWSSLYLVDRDGEILAHSGDTPLDVDRKAALASVKPGTSGVVQLNRSGRVPVAAAVVPVGDGTRKLVCELTPDAFNQVLTRSGLGRSWLADASGRIIASNQGFVAFSSMPSPGGHTLAATAQVKGATAVDGLRWRVVTHKPLSWLRLAGYEAERHAELAALLALAAAALGLGWLELTVLRPLRALDRSASALAAGDRTAVIFPVHHDEVGSVARSLELVRQQLAASPREAPREAHREARSCSSSSASTS
ncbi:HAMP domain-containing protein [Streptomyces sp. AC550_RSS872]|uniref:HAMP domain-containing protein n=1 Tax=Streptomyces sp. AC550_RSS872 TaxID=2823689 RepID=UPI001C27A5E9|nr:HAMP domain-containing protein [Streptomyces sp. AC550_RSS872]